MIPLGEEGHLYRMRYIFLSLLLPSFGLSALLVGQTDEALDLLRKGEYQQAIKLLQQEVDSGLNLPESYFLLGVALSGAGRFDLAVQ